ncbi:MAG: ribosome-binding factor A [Marinoscillum sp.]
MAFIQFNRKQSEPCCELWIFAVMTQNKRQHKFGKQIQKDLSEIFQKDSRHYFGGSLVTITGVEMSPDLGFAKVFLSIFPIINTEEVFASINDKKREIRGHLGKMIGKQVRVVPEIAFFHDDTEERASEMDRIIRGLNIPKSDETSEE